ncbi:MAG: hypothetical protein IKD33_06800 [Bacteroidales bacterium]|nr:hypothetical protein [Bacteroidales bacterium]
MIEILINRQISICREAEDNIQCSRNPPAGYGRGAGSLRSVYSRRSKYLPSAFEKGGERCSETLVVDVRKWW